MGALVDRFDFHRLDAARVKQTTQGFLTVAGRLTRVGVLDYYRADGSVYRELRHPEDVFDVESLSTLAMAPVTDLHGGMVSPDNVQALGVGIVGHDVVGRGDGPFVTGSATIQRRDTIDAVLARRRTELSPGYRCFVEDGADTWDGTEFGLGLQKYDGRQRRIRYNHLAVGPTDWGRSGRDVALHMDSMDSGAAFARCDSDHGLGGFVRDRLSLLNRTQNEIAAELGVELIELGMILDGFITPDGALLEKLSGLIDVPTDRLKGMIPVSEKGEAIVSRKRDDNTAAPPPTQREDTHAMKKTIVLKGTQFEIEIDDRLAPTFDSMLDKLHEDAAALPGVQGELLAAKKSNTDLQVKVDTAEDPELLQGRINARTKVVEDAKRIAPELKVDSAMSDSAIKIAALVASGYDAASFEKCDSAFVDGAWMGALRTAATPTTRTVAGPKFDGADPVTLTAEDLKTPIRAADCTRAHSDAARDRMIEDSRKMHEAPLNASRAAQ